MQHAEILYNGFILREKLFADLLLCVKILVAKNVSAITMKMQSLKKFTCEVR